MKLHEKNAPGLSPKKNTKMAQIKKIWPSIFLTLLFVIVGGYAKAQVTSNLEDLDKEVAHLSNKEKASVYLQCYDYFINTDIQKAYQCTLKAYSVLKESDNQMYLALCYHNFGSINKLRGEYQEAIENFNKSVSLFKKNNNKIGLCECYNNLGSVYKNRNELDSAMKYYTKAYHIADEANYKKGIISSMNNTGLIFLRQEHYDKAIQYFEKSLTLQNVPDYSVLNNLGAAYKEKKNLSKAIEYYQQSLKIAEEHNSLQNQAPPLGNIGTIYFEQGEYKNAIEYYKKSQQIEERLNLKAGLVATYCNIGHVYRAQKEFDSSLIYYNKALELAIETSARHTLPKIYTGMALSYEDMGQYVKAIDYLYTIIKTNRELFDIEKNAQIEELLTKYEIENKEKELIILKKDKKIQKTELAKKMAELDKQKLLRRLEAEKSKNEILLLNKQNELQALNLQKNKIEKEKKEEKIISLTKESELQQIKFEKEQSELRQKSLVKNIAILVAVILILAAIILIVLYQQKLKAIELLNLRTEEVNKQKIYKLLSDQEFLAMKASMEGQERERKRIAQDLHDGIGGNLASIKLNLANIINDTDDEKLRKVMKNIDETYNEVRSISHNLLPSRLMDAAFTGLIINFVNEILNKKHIKVNFEAFPKDELNQLATEIKVEVYRIIQELMNNIVKYSKAKNVDIQLIKRSGQVNLMVEDDGVGFDVKKAATGIGLRNIQSRIEEMDGEISIESSIGNWSLVNIEIPIKGKL